MEGSGTLPSTLLFLSYLIKRHFNKPVVLINHTADFYTRPYSGWLRACTRYLMTWCSGTPYRTMASPWRRQVRGRQHASGSPPSRDRNGSRSRIGPPSSMSGPTQLASIPPGLTSASVALRSTSRVHPRAISAQWIHLIEHIHSHYSGQIVLTAADWIDEVVFHPSLHGLGSL